MSGAQIIDLLKARQHSRRYQSWHSTEPGKMTLDRAAQAAKEYRPRFPGDVHRQLEDLERKAARYLWPLADLARQVDSLTVHESERRRLHRLLEKLHDAALDSGLRCLPAPVVTREPDTGVEFEWFYKKAQRVLAFALSDEGGDVWMYWAKGGAGHQEIDPTDARIVDALCWVSGVKFELEAGR